MKRLGLYDEVAIARQRQRQEDLGWDLEKDIQWSRGIDLSKPLVALDREAFFFPNAGPEERLALSQVMGLVIAVSIFEMEECLLRLRKEGWMDIYRRHPVSPEFIELGELFFEEEAKHSLAFKRYFEQFAQTANVDPATLREILPVVENTTTEKLLRRNAAKGGQSFWWIVAGVEQEFVHIYKRLRPHRASLDPLYFELHQRHFEEEALHAPFPFMMLELLLTREKGVMAMVRGKSDLAVAQFMQAAWALKSLSRVQKVRRLAKEHPFFAALARVYPALESRSIFNVVSKLFTSTPYVSSLLNPRGHADLVAFAHEHGVIMPPFPNMNEGELAA